jgi:hypothetical protein
VGDAHYPALKLTDTSAPKADLEKDPVRKRAAIRSNLFPDVVNCDLPLDNQRAPVIAGSSRYGNGFIQDVTTGGFVAQYPTGRYSKAHYHQSGAVLVCLCGEGYTFNWPVELGPTPWTDGHGDKVNRVDYVPGGLVAAAPGGGGWFHQHFGVGAEPLRILNYWGGPYGRWGSSGDVGEKDVKAGNMFGINEAVAAFPTTRKTPTFVPTSRCGSTRLVSTSPCRGTVRRSGSEGGQRRGSQLTAMLACLVSDVTLARIAGTEANVAAQVGLRSGSARAPGWRA